METFGQFKDFEIVFDKCHAPAVVLDPALCILWCNEAYERVADTHRDQLIGHPLFEAIPSGNESQTQELLASFQHVLQTGKTHRLSVLQYDLPNSSRPEQNYYWAVLNTPIFDEFGNVQYILNQPTNITELVRLKHFAAEHESATRMPENGALERSYLQLLAKERIRIHEMFKQAPGFVCVLVGPQHTYETTNQAYLDLVGRTDIVGKTVSQVLPELVTQGIVDLLDYVYSSGQTYVGRAMPILLNLPGQVEPEERYLDFVYQPMRDDNCEITGIFVQGYDVTETHKLTKRITYEAKHDPLTGLYNRREMEERSQALEQVEGSHAVLYMDLDHFKIINDRCGHNAGDVFLKQLAEALETVRLEGLLARIGGDEFLVLLENCDIDQAEELAQEFLHTVNELNFFWQGSRYSVGVSIGIALFGSELNVSFTQALANADSACFLAKDKGRARIQLSDVNDADLSQLYSDMDWTNRLKDAMRDDRIELFGQSIVALDSPDVVVHKEVLSRLRTESGEIIAPGAFITAAERYGLIEQLDRHILRKTFELLSEPGRVTCRLFVNVSGITLSNPTFVAYIDALLERYPEVAADNVCIEITETAAVTNLQRTAEMMDRIQARGIDFALDDFGSGVATFTYLEKLPIRYVKIDGEFIQNVTTSPVSQAIVASIQKIAGVMSLTTIAERIEEPSLIKHLESLGINLGQGYAIHRPEPL